MAYMSQEKKAALAPGIKAVLKKYGMKGTISVRHHSTLVVNIQAGPIDFGPKDYNQINPYWVEKHYDGAAKYFLLELVEAMSVGNWDKSDYMTDYFNVGWYTNINVGQWDKPYRLTRETDA